MGNTNSAIIYLTRSKRKDIVDLTRSLSLLDTNFNNDFHYPVIIFHEDLNDTQISDIQSATRSSLYFEKIQFQLPENKNAIEIPEFVYVDGMKFPIGYRHMCRFMTSLIFQHLTIRKFEFIWRLDTDSFILDKIDYDVFEFMKTKNYVYSYIHIMKDEPACVVGLWEATKKYIESNNISPKFLNKFLVEGAWDRSYFYTNFEISKVDIWLRDEFVNYFQYIDDTGGIYQFRWGDHVIHLLALAMFIPENQIHKFSDIAYQHQLFVNNPKADGKLPITHMANRITIFQKLIKIVKKFM